MPVMWPYLENLIRLGGVGSTAAAGGAAISTGDADRQTATARAVLDSLADQPGVVLADEVGMGKTYVAMAVIASVLAATKGRPPVVVMTPPGLASKWRAEWQQFKTTCLADPAALASYRDAFAGNPTDFFRAMDRGAGRAHLIWVSTRCFSRGLQDPWIKLALCRAARSKTKMSAEARKRFYKWAGELVRMKSRRQVTPELIRRLMATPLRRWHDRLVSEGIIGEGDPGLVPRHLVRQADDIDCSALVDVLIGRTDRRLPGRHGAVSGGRLRDARGGFNQACQKAYKSWIRRAGWDASLLVLDEAHHAKNDETWLAQMFRPRHWDKVASLAGRRHEEAPGDGEDKPIFWGKFDRMLFLTATPFQLGHDELIRVLRSFAAAKWSGPAAPARDYGTFVADLEELKGQLDQNRMGGRRLDDLWSRVTWERVARHAVGGVADRGDAVAAWWAAIEAGGGDPFDREVVTAVRRFQESKATTECHPRRPWASLRTWVIRHNRPRALPRVHGEEDRPRRVGRHGRSILDAGEQEAEGGIGLDLGAEDPLPFLLAARAQGELAGSPGRGRAFFAEGLASSYEAFHHTREGRGGDVRDSRDDDSVTGADALDGSVVPVAWYERQVEAFVPDRVRVGEAAGHPKLRAVVGRVVDLWRRGEKVLIFCTYRQTARALRDHIRHAVDRAIDGLVVSKLNSELKERAAARAARKALQRTARRLSDPDGPLHRELIRFLDEVFDCDAFRGLADHHAQLLRLLVGYVRSHSFIARYLPLVGEGEDGTSAAAALAEAIHHTADHSGTTLRERVEEFLRFASELAARGRAADALADEDEPSDLLGNYLKDVAVSIRARDDDADPQDRGTTARALPVVRMVYGQTRPDVRERVMGAFNSPLFPEILISSAVLAEGVDLHRFCRFIIHHDLSWNPSVIEQRTGRLDRIRCRAEASRRPIVAYEPYIAESADEKLYRVLRDRERWFQVVMGQRFSFDERTAEAIAARVPLPPALADQLLFDLRRHK